MQSLASLVAISLCLVLCIHSGLGLKCYECKSYVNQICASLDVTDPEAATYLVDCPANATACRKVEQRLTYDGEERIRYYRQCAISEGPKRCVERSGTIGVKMFYCDCESDQCNSASAISTSVTLFAACMSVFYVVRSYLM